MEECVICLDRGRGWTKLPCGHQFHERCLQHWTLRTPRCPLCWNEIVIDVAPEAPCCDERSGECCTAVLVAFTWLSMSCTFIVMAFLAAEHHRP
jgi:hypothetical protein